MAAAAWDGTRNEEHASLWRWARLSDQGRAGAFRTDPVPPAGRNAGRGELAAPPQYRPGARPVAYHDPHRPGAPLDDASQPAAARNPPPRCRRARHSRWRPRADP